MAKRTFNIKTGITRNYGKHEVNFEISEQVEVETTGSLREAFLNLHALLDDQIKTYEAIQLPHVSLPQGTQGTNSNAANQNTFLLETIRVEFVDNKRRIRATGGNYTKHGVPVYEECKTDIGMENLSFGVHDYRSHNLMVTAELDGDKPRRVLSIK